MKPSDYPSFVFKAGESPVCVHSLKQFEALGAGWSADAAVYRSCVLSEATPERAEEPAAPKLGVPKAKPAAKPKKK